MGRWLQIRRNSVIYHRYRHIIWVRRVDYVG